MFFGPDAFDSESIPPVVIIGSGPAGMTLAVSLAEKKIPSLILEAGEEGFYGVIQDDYLGEITGDTYIPLDVGRRRQFGGSSNCWNGWCRPLDAWDFDAIPEAGIPGWPIKKEDLDPYAAKTHDILEIPATVDQRLGEFLHEAQFSFSPPVRFGKKYKRQIETSPYMNVALESAVTGLHAEGGRIARVDFVDARGTARSLAPKMVVVACGGIENSRLLLWSNVVSAEPVVSNTETLGRYWMEHPHEDVGEALLFRRIHKNRLQRGIFSVVMDPERARQHNVLNAGVRLEYTRTVRPGKLLRKGLCWIHPSLTDMTEGIQTGDEKCGSRVRVVWEQAPDADNRIVLSTNGRDRLGMPHSHLFWRKTEQDYRTVRVAFETVAAHVVGQNAGMFRAYPQLVEMGNYPDTGLIGGNHHMGGTRMSETASGGIVDRNLKLHDMSNGYVAGSSVFVRSGHANPTYTIVQLSLRLADHLAERLGA